MPKISITKKMIWSLILKINSNHKYKVSKNIININEVILDKEIDILYDRKNNDIKNKNILFSDTESFNIFKIFFPIVCCSSKNQYIAHIAQSLDGFIATESGESKYISGKKNIEHIHRLRALSDIIIVGVNTYLDDKPKLTTRLVTGPNPDIYVFDPKEIIKKRDQFEQRREQESDFNLRVNVHPTVLERLRNEDEDIFIDMEKRYLVKISFRAEENMHQEEFEVYDANNNTSLARANR